MIDNADELDEHLSMEHSRVALMRLVPAVGDTLVTNHRRPILSFVEDTTAGIHDMLMAACDVYRYEQLGAVGYHDNCTDNLRNALEAIGLRSRSTPSPMARVSTPVSDEICRRAFHDHAASSVHPVAALPHGVAFLSGFLDRPLPRFTGALVRRGQI